MVKFAIKGQPYEMPELDDVTTKELREIKQQTGMGLRALATGFQDMDPDAFTAVVYIAKRRAGEDISWSDLDDLRPVKDVEWPDEEDEDHDGGEPDPPTKSPDDGTAPGNA